MKYVVLLIVLIAGGLAYVRFEQPQIWNDYLASVDDTLKAPEAAPQPAAVANQANEAPAPAQPPPTAPVTTSEIISPDTKNYVNPDHVRQVDQPGETPAPTNAPAASRPDTNLPATNTPATNTPATNAPIASPPTTP